MKVSVTRAYFHIFSLILAAVVFQACTSTGTSSETTPTADEAIISAQGAFGRLEAATSGSLYTGDGGENIRLAILAPQIQGVVPAYLPGYIQGSLYNNFNKYSAINLIDRQYLDTIIAEQNLAANGRFSDSDYISIGKITNAQFLLSGTIQKLSGDQYSLQLSIINSSTAVLRASFMKNGYLTQLEGRGTLLNEAAAELLDQLGVQLTETGLQALLVGNTSTVEAEAERIRELAERQAQAQRERETAQIPPPVPTMFTDPARFWSIGVSAGTSFAAPWAIGTIRGTIAPLRYSFLELGFDYGMISGIEDAEFYYSLYPFAHYTLFLPFAQSAGWYAGAGGGYMLAEYTFPEEKIPVNIFALDVTTGIILWNMLNVSYTLRTNFKSANNKMSIGYTYRFR